MELPGGLLCDSKLLRDYRFQPVTGELERKISDSGFTAETFPQQVTSILSDSLDTVAGRPVDETLVRSLNAGDRQFLLLQLDALINPSSRWITSRCNGCNQLIQFQLVPGTLPIKPAGEGYPQVMLELSVGPALVRVPNGSDEEAIAVPVDDASPLERLLLRLVSVNGRPVDVDHLTKADLQLIDHTLDEMSPQSALTAQVNCPHCQLGQEVVIDANAWIAKDSVVLDRDIHTLAFYYHWSEKEILQLSRRRRERYLQLIDQSLGKYRADEMIQGAQGGVW